MGLSEPTAGELLAVVYRTDLSPSARLAWMLELVNVRRTGHVLAHRDLATTLGVTERRARGITLELFEAAAIRATDWLEVWFPDVDAEPQPDPGKKWPRADTKGQTTPKLGAQP